MGNECDFTVILPVCHGGLFLRRALGAVCALNYSRDRYEVVVAVEACDEESSHAADKAAATGLVRSIRVEGTGRAALLNAACAAARGRLLAFTDDDCVPPADWLANLHEAFEREDRAGAVGGRDEGLPTGAAVNDALDWMLMSPFAAGRFRRGPANAEADYYPRLWNMAVRRSAAMAVALDGGGGPLHVFDESLDVYEDVDLSRRLERAGWHSAYAPDAVVRHYRDASFGAILRRNFAMSRAARTLGVRREAHSLISAALVAGVLWAVLAVVHAPARLPLLVAAACGGALLLAAGAIAALAKRRLALIAVVPPLLAGVVAARGLGYLLPAASRR